MRAIVIAAVGLTAAPAYGQLVSAQLTYPPSALRAGREGVVRYEVKLAKDGKVTGCRVTQASGDPALDRATCDQLRKNARFKPTIDASGKPISSRYTSRVRWTLPAPPPAPGTPASPQR